MRALQCAPVVITAAGLFGACNMISGASDVEFGGDEAADETTSGPTTGGQGGASATTGPAAVTSGTTVTTGGGGTMTSSVASSTSAASTSAASTSATSATSAASATTSTTGGGEMCSGASEATTTLDAEEQAFLVIINDYRKQNGLGPLTACRSLNRAAQGHSEDMRDKNYFSHTGLNGSSPFQRSCQACFKLGCGPATAMAENIAAGNAGAQATFTQWKNSPGHNTNMLGKSYTMIGIGRATGGGKYGVYWTNVFAGKSEASCQ